MSMSKEELSKIAADRAVQAVNNLFESPEFKSLKESDGKISNDMVSPSMAEAVVSGVAGAIVAEMIPGPGIPG